MLLEKVRLVKNIWVWCVIAVGYYLLIRQNMFICDDFRYAFVQGTDEPVNGLSDAIRSQMHAYIYENGRFLVHTIVQYLAGVLDIEWLRVANTAFFVIICIFLKKILSRRNPSKGASVAVIILALLLCIPVPGYSYLGNIAMSVNYLWTSALSLAYIYLLELSFCETRTHSHLCCFFLLVSSFVVGAWQESFSIGLSVALLAYLYIHRKSVKKANLMFIISYWIGATFVILAPSNFLREAGWNDGNTSFVGRLIQGFCSVVVYAKTFDTMVLLLLVLLFHDKHKLANIVKTDLVFIVTAIVNVFFVACVAFTGPHQLVCIELFSSIVILHILSEVFPAFYNKASFVASIVIISLFLPIYYYRSQVHDAYYQMIERAKISTDGYLIGGNYDSLSFMPRNWVVRTYTTTEKNQDCPLGTLSMWLTNGINKDFLRMRIPLTKEELINICNEINEESSSVFHRSEDWFYVVRVDSLALTKQVRVGYEENWLSSLRSRLFGRYQKVQYRNDNLSNYSCFSGGGYTYYIIYDDEFYPIVNIELINEVRQYETK